MTETHRFLRVVRDDRPDSLRAQLRPVSRPVSAYEEQLADQGLVEGADGIWQFPPVDLDG